MKIKINKKTIACPDESGFDEFQLKELGKNVVNGLTPVYILESPDDESFFFSKEPINIEDLRNHFDTDEFLLGRGGQS